MYPKEVKELIDNHCPLLMIFDFMEDHGFDVSNWRVGHGGCENNLHDCFVLWALYNDKEISHTGEVSDPDWFDWDEWRRS